MTRFAPAVAAALMMATSAFAGEISLDREIQAASLHEPGIDMVVYYTGAQNGAVMEVVATYIETATPETPYRMMMGLNDQDRVRFALPGMPETAFTFERSGETLNVTSHTERRIAIAK